MDTECKGISLNVSEKVRTYIDSHTVNRSEWMKEAGKELLQILNTFFIPELTTGTYGKRIITISKPIQEELEEIYELVTHYQIILSRSEFYRIAAIFKIIIDSINNKDQAQVWKHIQQEKQKGIVKVPMKIDENGETVFKAYRILKRLDY